MNDFIKKFHLTFGRLTIFLLLLSLSLLLIVELILSLQWKMAHDSPLIHYIAFLMDQHGYVPYKDFYDMNLPGTYLFHLAIVKFLGYSDSAFMFVNLLWLCSILLITYLIMKRFGKIVAWGSSVIFGLSYLSEGHEMVLQREIIGLLPIGLAIFVAITHARLRLSMRSFLVGIFFGLSAIIKLHLIIGMPLVLFYLYKEGASTHNKTPHRPEWFFIMLRIVFFSFLGLAIPILSSFIWLWRQGAMPYFLEWFLSYMPLYLSLTGDHKIRSGFPGLIYLLMEYIKLGKNSLWVIPAFFGIYITFFNTWLSTSHRRLLYLLSGLTVLYSIYPVISGQFWIYHWMPFRYFIILAASLTLVSFYEQHRVLSRATFAILIFVITLFLKLHPFNGFLGQIKGLPVAAPKNGRVYEIAYFLKTHLKPKDKVQPLDWSGGAIHAMLLSKAEITTPFLYDFHFYHHISNPYIKTLRKRFIGELKRSSPRFIIAILTMKPWVYGADTTREFTELKETLSADYTVKVNGDGYVIYERLR